MSDQLGVLEKARDELRKQFFSYAESLAQGFQRPKTFGDMEEIVKVRAAIEALDKAIADESSRRSPAQSQDFSYRGTSPNIEPGPNDSFKTP